MVRHGLGRYPAALDQIAMPHLVALLVRHREFLERSGITLGERIDPEAYERLVELVADPGDLPAAFAESLQLILELSTPDAMDLLLDEAAARGVEIIGFPDPTPADVAAQLLVRDRKLVESVHSRRFAAPSRAFSFFRSAQPSLWEPQLPPADGARRIQEALDEWFESRRRGRGVRVTVHPDGERVQFLIRHGDPLRRVAGLRENGSRTSVAYRAESLDVVVYDPARREIGISAEITTHIRTYRRIFGEQLFGNAEQFRASQKYSLLPLERDGIRSLACGDVEGIRSARLIEVSAVGDAEEIVLRSRDVLAACAARQDLLPRDHRLASARIALDIAGSRTRGVVTLRPSNVSEYPIGIDTEALERWLSRRGFLLDRSASHASATLGHR